MTANTTASVLTMVRVGSEDQLHATGCRDLAKHATVLAAFDNLNDAKESWCDEDEYLEEGASGWDWVRVMPCAAAAIKTGEAA